MLQAIRAEDILASRSAPSCSGRSLRRWGSSTLMEFDDAVPIEVEAADLRISS